MTALAALDAGALTTILTVVLSGGALSAVLALLLFPSQRAKLGAEREAVRVASDVSLAGGYGELVQALREERVSMRAEIERQGAKIDRQGAKIDRLEESLAMSRSANARLDESVELGRRESAKLRAALAEFSDTINGPKNRA